MLPPLLSNLELDGYELWSLEGKWSLDDYLQNTCLVEDGDGLIVNLSRWLQLAVDILIVDGYYS
jgi:hypothetical protein